MMNKQVTNRVYVNDCHQQQLLFSLPAFSR